jgi:PAS domain S-box-containing protein
MGTVRLALGGAALALGIASLVATLQSDHVDHRALVAAFNLLIGWSFTASGLLAWKRRPENRVGLLMVVMGLTWLLGAFQASDRPGLFTFGLLLSSLPLAVFCHLILAFPEGRPRTPAARAVTLAAYAAATVGQLLALLFFEPRAPRFECEECPTNGLLISRNDDVAEAIFAVQNAVAVVLVVAIIVILVHRWQDATAPARRMLAPVYATAAIALVLGALFFASVLAWEGGQEPLQWATLGALATVPLGFLVGLLYSRLARASVIRLVLELRGAVAPTGVRDALARALGDPSLELAYWLPESESYVDADGEPVELPGAGSQQVATLVERDGRRIGALVHDRSLNEHQELVDAVCAAGGLALENERLQVELRARVAELRQNEGRLRALIDASPLAIVEVDRAGLVTFWNRAAERLYGWTSEEVIGQEISFIPKQEAGEVDRLRERLLDGQAFENVETLRLRKDGSLVDVALSAGPVYGADGAIVRLMAVSAGITERKRAQEELRRERDFTSALIDNAPVLVIVFDREGRLLRFNRECERLTGYSFEEVARRDFFDLFILADEAERVRTALERVWAGDFPSVNENHWLTRDGEKRLILWSNSALLDDRGQIEYIVSAGLDVTERRRAEKELQESEARFRELANSAPVMIWMADTDGRVTFLNQRWLEFIGRSAEEEMGHGWQDHVHPEDLEVGVTQWLVDSRAGKPHESEYRLRRADGEYRWVFDRGLPRFLPDGTLAGYLGITIDITDRKAAEAEIRASRARIVEAGDAERRRLERNLHDGAQQRLVSLSLALRLAQSKVSASPEDAEQILVGAGEELAQALTELRELARGIHPAILTDRGLPAALDALAGRAPTPVDVEIALDERLPPSIEAAAYYVVSEALANIAKYAQATAVTVSIGRQDGYALVEVADDGIGGADPTRGSGLRGLADRVEALDGRLEVVSPPGAGTRIRAQIPVQMI